jgi:hypothetical protein
VAKKHEEKPVLKPEEVIVPPAPAPAAPPVVEAKAPELLEGVNAVRVNNVLHKAVKVKLVRAIHVNTTEFGPGEVLVPADSHDVWKHALAK